MSLTESMEAYQGPSVCRSQGGRRN